MRYIKLIVISLCLLLVHSTIKADNENKSWKKFSFNSESKKKLRAQIDSLNLVVDSLNYEISTLIGENTICIDSIASDEFVNPGGFEIEDSDNLVIESPADTDSLLIEWYSRNLFTSNNDISELDKVSYTSNTPDSVFLHRLQKMNSFIDIPYNNIVKNHIIYYTQKIPNKAEVILGLSSFYMPQFEEIFDQYDLPKELKALSIIESALNPKAVSKANARGMWQFMYNTARQYGLRMNSYVDERYDPIKSGHAAAKYLRDSYNIFGDWALALASYNCGLGNVNKAIKRANSRDFWTLYPYLPRETRGYVPSFVAALYLLEYYNDHNLTPSKISMPPHVDTIHVNKMLHFDQITENIGISKEELRTLNPQYLHDIVPGVEHQYILRLPYNYTSKFVEKENEIYTYKDSVYFNPTALKRIVESAKATNTRITYVVKSGDTVGGIALKYRVKQSDLVRWNNIKNDVIRIGQKLTIYTGGSGPSASSGSSGSSGKSSSTSKGIDTKIKNGYVVYTIKSGDTLYDIAKFFPGISADNICELNGLTSGSMIKPGMEIKIKPAD